MINSLLKFLKGYYSIECEEIQDRDKLPGTLFTLIHSNLHAPGTFFFKAKRFNVSRRCPHLPVEK